MSRVVHVTDHAIVRYLERVVGLDVEALRIEIAAACVRSQGAPCVRTSDARYLIRGAAVVTVLDGKTIPHFKIIAEIARYNIAEDQA